MKKIISFALALALCVSVFAGCSSASSAAATTTTQTASSAASSAGSTELNLYTWESMFPQEVLDAFTAETGIKVNFSSFDANETMLAKLETSKGGDYDIVVADDYIIQTAIAEGLATKLDKSLIANIGNVNPVYQSQFFDPKDEYTVPYGSGVMTIVYNPNAIDKDVKGYADLWDPAFADNIGIVGNYRVVDGIALKVLGESFNVTDLATIDKAGEKLLELAPNIRIIKDDNLQDDLISGEVNAAIMYTSQVTMACLANPDLKVVYPSEGVGFGVMAQFIPSNAPHADAAYKFIDYILRPEVSKQCFEALGYYCTNAAADELIDDAYKSFLTLPADYKGETEMIQNITAEADEEHVKIWTEFKAACGQ